MENSRFPNTAAAGSYVAIPDRDVTPLSDTQWFDLDQVPDRFISIPYVVLVNSNSKIEDGDKHIGEFVLSMDNEFLGDSIKVIPVSFGARQELRVTDREAGEVSEEECLILRAVLVREDGDHLPVVLNFRRKAKSAVRDMVADMKIKRRKGSECIYELTPVKVTNNRGQSWYIAKATHFAGNNTAAELAGIVDQVWGGIAADAPVDDDTSVDGVPF